MNARKINIDLPKTPNVFQKSMYKLPANGARADDYWHYSLIADIGRPSTLTVSAAVAKTEPYPALYMWRYNQSNAGRLIIDLFIQPSDNRKVGVSSISPEERGSL